MLRLLSAVRVTAPGGRTVIMGAMSSDDLSILKVSSYQRESLPVTSPEEWRKAFRNGEVPPLDLGVRSTFAVTKPTGFEIQTDEIYIIDGLQRVTVAQQLHREGASLCVLVVLHMDTTEAWEVDRFSKLNGNLRKPVSPNVLLRNARLMNPAIGMLYALSEEPGGVLCDRVRWSQTSRKGQLFTAVSLLRVAAALHHRQGSVSRGSNIPSLSWRLNDVMEEIGALQLGENVKTFFRLIDKSVDGGLGKYDRAAGVVQLSMGYMTSLARVLSGHKEFWSGDKLVITENVEQALATKVRLDPMAQREIASHGRPMDSLVERFVRAVVAARHRSLTPFE